MCACSRGLGRGWQGGEGEGGREHGRMEGAFVRPNEFSVCSRAEHLVEQLIPCSAFVEKRRRDLTIDMRCTVLAGGIMVHPCCRQSADVSHKPIEFIDQLVHHSCATLLRCLKPDPSLASPQVVDNL